MMNAATACTAGAGAFERRAGLDRGGVFVHPVHRQPGALRQLGGEAVGRVAARAGTAICVQWVADHQQIGAELLQPACGACANCGPGSSTDAQQVTVSAINRNFPGRSGPGQVWLASPPTVAASAIAGRLMSFDLLKSSSQIVV